MPGDPSREQFMAEIDEFMHSIFGSYMRRGHRPPLAHLELTLAQLECMRTIGHLGSPSMTELSRAMHLRPSTVTGLVDALIEHDQVERLNDPEDRRVVRVRLTDRGARERKRHLDRARRRMMALLADLEDDDLLRLRDALAQLHAAALRRSKAEDAAEEEDCR